MNIYTLALVLVFLVRGGARGWDTGGAAVRCVALWRSRAFLCAQDASGGAALLEAAWPDAPAAAPARPFAPAARAPAGDPCAAPVAPLAAATEAPRARLWLLDGGDARCGPQLFVYDLRLNREVWRCPLDGVPRGAARALAVDGEGAGGGAAGARAYVGDSGRPGGGLAVAALRERRFWFLDVAAPACAPRGVRARALAIAPGGAPPAAMPLAPPLLYLLDPDGDDLLALPLAAERARPPPPVYDRRPEAVRAEARCAGRLLGASSGLALDARAGLHYFLRRDLAAVRWDTRRPLTAEAHRVLLQDEQALPGVAQLFVDAQRNVWALRSDEAPPRSQPVPRCALHPDSQKLLPRGAHGAHPLAGEQLPAAGALPPPGARPHGEAPAAAPRRRPLFGVRGAGRISPQGGASQLPGAAGAAGLTSPLASPLHLRARLRPGLLGGRGDSRLSAGSAGPPGQAAAIGLPRPSALAVTTNPGLQASPTRRPSLTAGVRGIQLGPQAAGSQVGLAQPTAPASVSNAIPGLGESSALNAVPLSSSCSEASPPHVTSICPPHVPTDVNPAINAVDGTTPPSASSSPESAMNPVLTLPPETSTKFTSSDDLNPARSSIISSHSAPNTAQLAGLYDTSEPVGPPVPATFGSTFPPLIPDEFDHPTTPVVLSDSSVAVASSTHAGPANDRPVLGSGPNTVSNAEFDVASPGLKYNQKSAPSGSDEQLVYEVNEISHDQRVASSVRSEAIDESADNIYKGVMRVTEAAVTETYGEGGGNGHENKEIESSTEGSEYHYHEEFNVMEQDVPGNKEIFGSSGESNQIFKENRIPVIQTETNNTVTKETKSSATIIQEEGRVSTYQDSENLIVQSGFDNDKNKIYNSSVEDSPKGHAELTHSKVNNNDNDLRETSSLSNAENDIKTEIYSDKSDQVDRYPLEQDMHVLVNESEESERIMKNDKEKLTNFVVEESGQVRVSAVDQQDIVTNEIEREHTEESKEGQTSYSNMKEEDGLVVLAEGQPTEETSKNTVASPEEPIQYNTERLLYDKLDVTESSNYSSPGTKFTESPPAEEKFISDDIQIVPSFGLGDTLDIVSGGEDYASGINRFQRSNIQGRRMVNTIPDENSSVKSPERTNEEANTDQEQSKSRETGTKVSLSSSEVEWAATGSVLPRDASCTSLPLLSRADRQNVGATTPKHVFTPTDDFIFLSVYEETCTPAELNHLDLGYENPEANTKEDDTETAPNSESRFARSDETIKRSFRHLENSSELIASEEDGTSHSFIAASPFTERSQETSEIPGHTTEKTSMETEITNEESSQDGSFESSVSNKHPGIQYDVDLTKIHSILDIYTSDESYAQSLSRSRRLYEVPDESWPENELPLYTPPAPGRSQPFNSFYVGGSMRADIQPHEAMRYARWLPPPGPAPPPPPGPFLQPLWARPPPPPMGYALAVVAVPAGPALLRRAPLPPPVPVINLPPPPDFLVLKEDEEVIDVPWTVVSPETTKVIYRNKRDEPALSKDGSPSQRMSHVSDSHEDAPQVGPQPVELPGSASLTKSCSEAPGGFSASLLSQVPEAPSSARGDTAATAPRTVVVIPNSLLKLRYEAAERRGRGAAAGARRGRRAVAARPPPLQSLLPPPPPLHNRTRLLPPRARAAASLLPPRPPLRLRALGASRANSAWKQHCVLVQKYSLLP